MKIRREFTAGLLALILVCSELPARLQTAYATEEYSGDLRWDFYADTEGVTAGGLGVSTNLNISQSTVDGEGCLKITNNNPDNSEKFNGYINMDLGSVSSEYRYLRFRMKNITRNWEMPVRIFQDGSDTVLYGVKPEISNSFPNNFVEYEVDLRDKTRIWFLPNGTSVSGTVGTLGDSVSDISDIDGYDKLRLYFIGTATGSKEGYNGEIYIDNIVMSNHSKNDSENLISSVTLGEDEYTEFDPAKDVFETVLDYYSYNNLTQETAEDIISVESVSGAEVIGMECKTAGKTKVVDVTVKKDTAYRTYRFIMISKPRPITPVEITLDKCVWNGKQIEYSGTLSPGGSGLVTLIVKSKTDDRILWSGVISAKGDGNFSGIAGVYDEEEEPVKLNVNIIFDVLGLSEPYVIDDVYINDKYMQKQAEGAAAAPNAMDYIMENEDTFKRMGAWTDRYNALDEPKSLAVKLSVEHSKSELARDNVAEIINGNYMAQVLPDMDETEALALLSEFDERSAQITVSVKSFNDFTVEQQKWILNNTYNNSESQNWNELKTALRKSTLLAIVNSCAYADLHRLLVDNADLLDNKVSALENETDKDIINSAMKSIVLKARTAPYTDIDDLIYDISEQFKNADKPSTGGNNTSSNGGSGGSKTSVAVSGEPVIRTSEDKPEVFKDMVGYDWAKDAVERLYGHGIVNGVSDNIYEPGRNVKREEFVKMLVKALGEETDSVSVVFTDIPEGHWCATYVSKGAEMKLVMGLPDGSFGAGNDITREDMAVILLRAMQRSGCEFFDSGIDFADEDAISDYAKEAVAKLSGAGIINGVGNGRFVPMAPATRAEAAVMLSRCLDKISL